MAIPGLLKRIFAGKVTSPLPDPGLYHYQKNDGNSRIRIHLRINPDRSGILVVNANRIFHLNSSATLMCYLTLEGNSSEKAIEILADWYSMDKVTVEKDYKEIASQIQVLTSPLSHCPICELELEPILPFRSVPLAPYRMDLAITYRCNNQCAHCYNARPRDFQELSTEKWKSIIQKLWDIGIPHLVFTGGEPTLRNDLPELIEFAEKTGMITGLNTNGMRLANPDYLKQLVDAGLDHVQITLESHIEFIHDEMVAHRGAWRLTVEGIRNALKSSLYVMTNTTLLQQNSPFILDTIQFLHELGVPTIGMNALIYSGHGKSARTGLPESRLPELLEHVNQAIQQTGQKLIWYTPTHYCDFNPLEMGLGIKGCTAALYAMAIEPNGDVIPCQSYYSPLGNLLSQSWESIWNHPLAVSIRNRQIISEECKQCQILDVCGGGCPLARGLDPSFKPSPILDEITRISCSERTSYELS
ncbi:MULTISPECIES: radical SAM/SPASM domain-containing protein [Anaerolinea]|uniref:radical SAM/SPASM domain-containing protein n=1 Tax=Anaerolinea TaxID=233189 RepID=UPI00262B3734|nr:radical SAM protein [Anaerolinea thermophila]